MSVVRCDYVFFQESPNPDRIEQSLRAWLAGIMRGALTSDIKSAAPVTYILNERVRIRRAEFKGRHGAYTSLLSLTHEPLRGEKTAFALSVVTDQNLDWYTVSITAYLPQGGAEPMKVVVPSLYLQSAHFTFTGAAEGASPETPRIAFVERPWLEDQSFMRMFENGAVNYESSLMDDRGGALSMSRGRPFRLTAEKRIGVLSGADGFFHADDRYCRSEARKPRYSEDCVKRIFKEPEKQYIAGRPLKVSPAYSATDVVEECEDAVKQFTDLCKGAATGSEAQSRLLKRYSGVRRLGALAVEGERRKPLPKRDLLQSMQSAKLEKQALQKNESDYCFAPLAKPPVSMLASYALPENAPDDLREFIEREAVREMAVGVQARSPYEKIAQRVKNAAKMQNIAFPPIEETPVRDLEERQDAPEVEPEAVSVEADAVNEDDEALWGMMEGVERRREEGHQRHHRAFSDLLASFETAGTAGKAA